VTERREVTTIGVIGPTNVARVAEAAGLDPAGILDAAVGAGRQVAEAGSRLLVVPDRGVALAALTGYREAGGIEAVGLVPDSGVCEPAARGALATNASRCDRLVRECSWYEQHHRIGVLSDALVCVGLSCGTLAEIAWTKWTPGPPVALIRGTFSVLPAEMMAETPVTVVEPADLSPWLWRVVSGTARSA
jgi:hypothetical protein